MGRKSYSFNNDQNTSLKSNHGGKGQVNGAFQRESNGFRDNINTTSGTGSESIDMADITYKEKPKEPTKVPANHDTTKEIGALQMFRYADGLDKLLIVIGSIAAIVHGLTNPVNFLVYGQVVTGFIYFDLIPDNLTEAYNMSLPFNVDDYTDVFGNTKEYAIYFYIVGIVCIVSGTIQYTCWDISMERQMLKMRCSLLKSIVHQDMSWFDQHNAGELGTSFTESISHIEDGIGKELSIFLQWMSTCIGCYVLAFVKGWKLALACVAFAPAIALTGAFLVKWVKNLSVTEGKAYAKAGSVVTEVLTAIKTVMSFNGQDKESERYDRCLGEANRMGVKKGLAMGLGFGIIWFFIYSLLATAFGYGVKLFSDGEPGFEPGNVILIFMNVMFGSMSLSQAAPTLETIAKAKAAAIKVFGIIDTKPTIDSSSIIGRKLKNISGSIQLQNVRFTYPSRSEVEVLKDVSITMNAGQTVAIVGHSGCGKSTIVQLIERFYDVSSGKILIDGEDVRELNVDWLRNQIGLVSQEPVLFSTTVRENIQFGRMDVTDTDIQQAARDANIHEFIEQLPEGYNTMVGQRGTQLSGGQKQRIAIARALVRDPKILLLDEATSALDTESEAVVQKALENAQKGRTTVVIAHRLSTIKNADVIVAMDNGAIMETGTHEELMAGNGLYAELVQNQTQQSSEGEVSQHIAIGRTTSVQSVSMSILAGSNADDDASTEEENKADVSWKRLLRMNAPEWRFLLAGTFCATGTGALYPALAFLISEYLKVFSEPDIDQTDFRWTMTGIIMGVAVVNAAIRISQNIFFSISGELLTSRLRRLTFKAFLKQDMTFFDDPKHQVSILSTRLSTDANRVHGATGSKISFTMETLAIVITGLAISFISSWRLSLVVLGFLPLMIASGTFQSKIVMGLAKANKDLTEQAGHICTEAIDNVKLVASLGRENTFKDRYNEIISIVTSKALKRTFFTSALLGFSTSLVFFGYGVSFTYGSYLMQEGLIPYYLVIRVFATIMFGGSHIGRVSVVAGDFTKAKLAASRLFCFIDNVPKIDSSSDGGEKKVQIQGDISFHDVEFNYPFRTDVQVLNQLSFQAKAGETIALVGASGCGKSTTVALLERFYDPLSGHVTIDGIDTRSMNLKWLRSQIGFVQQEPVLFDCSIADNIAYGVNDREVGMDEIIAAARSANIHSFIDALPKGYDTNVGNKGTQLSGGQKQRVAIARAILSNPRILLLDEATSALDSKSEQIVQEALDVAQKGRTCIVIAHRLSTIQNADKIAIIHKGSVVEMGSHSELIAERGIYYKFLNMQNTKEKV